MQRLKKFMLEKQFEINKFSGKVIEKIINLYKKLFIEICERLFETEKPDHFLKAKGEKIL